MTKESFFISLVKIAIYIIVFIVLGIKDGMICLLFGDLIMILTIMDMCFKKEIYLRKEYEQLKEVCVEIIVKERSKS